MATEAPAKPLPTIEETVPCRACGEPIAFVRVLPGRDRRPISIRPHPFGEYLLLRHDKALNLRHEHVIDDVLA